MANEILANESSASATQPTLEAPSEHDYRAFCNALEASSRGRAFLAEYARRNRHANTEVLLAALDRLEAVVRSQAATSDADRIRQELRALLSAMSAAQPTIDAGAAAIKAAKLAALIEFVQHRIESIAAPSRAPLALPAEVAALVMSEAEMAEAARAHLAVVPRADEPELPIPVPAAQAPAFALVHDPEKWEPAFGQDHAQTKQVHVPALPEPAAAQAPEIVAPPQQEAPRRRTTILPDLNIFEPAPMKPIVVVERQPQLTEIAAAPPARPAILAAAAIAIETAAAAQAEAEATSADDPLALIMALSEAERIALFS